MIPPHRVDAISPTPKTGAIVYLHGRPYNRNAIETAWLLLDADESRLAVRAALIRQGLSLVEASHTLEAAQLWTGNIAQGSVPQ